MNTRQIEAFRAVARIGTVTGAAAVLNISQPAVSRLLAHLESQVRLQLFARSKGRLHLTPEGIAFLGDVDRHFTGLDELNQAARRIAEHGPGNLRIVGFPSITSSVLPKALALHLARHPDASVSLDTDTTDRIVSRISVGAYDLGFTAGFVSEGFTVDSQVISSKPWVCVMPANHRLGEQANIELSDLVGESLIGFSPGMSLRQHVDRVFMLADIEPKYRVAAQTIESMCALVAEGCGIAIVHPYATHIAQIFGLKTAIVATTQTLDLLAVTPRSPSKVHLADEIVQAVQVIAAEPVS